MKPFRKILVPVDYSSTAANAFNYAILLAKELNAEIELLNCVHPGMAGPELSTLSADLTNKLLQISLESMDAFVKDGIAKANLQVNELPTISQKVELGAIVPMTKSIAKEAMMDLIIMGTKGVEGFWQKLFGTVSGDVLMNAPCPVLVVPEESTFTSYNRLCLATNFDSSDINLLEDLHRVFEMFNPAFHLVHINNDESEKVTRRSTADLENIQQRLGVAIEIEERKSKDVPSSIIDTALDCQSNIIVMSRPHYNLIDQLFHHSITRDVAQQSNIPLLVTPQENE